MRLRAYLVSGEFRVHRAGCRDCEKEARRSDSAGDAEEYASRAEVIAGLWSDIIAENPELYGTPGGLASLEAETIFLPCTSGLPGTSPAGEGGQPGDAEELAAWAGRARPGGGGPGRPRPRRLQQAGLRGEQRRPGLPGQVPDRVLRHRGRPVPAQRPAARGSRPGQRSRYCRACGCARSSARRRLLAGSRPASAAGGPACCHAGGRVKPTTGDSPPLEPGSP